MADDQQRPNQDNKRDDGPGRPGPRPPMRMGRGVFAWAVLVGITLLLVATLGRNMEKPEPMSLPEFYTHLENKDIKSVTLKTNAITGTLRPAAVTSEESADFTVSYIPSAIDSRFIDSLMDKCITHDTEFMPIDQEDDLLVPLLIQLVPWILVFLFLWFVVFRQFRNAGGGAGMLGNFGRSRHRVTTKEHTSITFKDVAGIDEAKDEVTEIIEFLKDPRKFARLGGRIPRGVLLVGEPGCGKTLLAKAIAGEAEVPFFSISGSDFVEMFVGVGASRVRDLFKQAKENAPCIIFLDEIDAVGRRRGAGFNGGGHDEREQTLNAILVEMDGFDTNDQVIVCAATNRSDVLDPALTRPGRFDRQVFVPLPDIKGRLEILRVHAKKIKLGPDVDMEQLARGTPMFSGADLAAIINEAALAATLENKEHVEHVDLEEARDKVRWGRAKKSRVITEDEKRTIAYHEAGHALIAELLPEADPLHKVSILPRGQAGGVTLMLPQHDRHLYTRKYALASLKVFFGGRVAEELFCNDISSGAVDDIRRASMLARTMVCDWGMSERLGPVRYAPEEQMQGSFASPMMGRSEYSDETAQIIDEEIKQILQDAYATAKQLLEDYRQQTNDLAEALLRYETVESEDVRKILRGEKLNRPTVAALLDAEARRGQDADASADADDADQRTEPGDASGPLPSPT